MNKAELKFKIKDIFFRDDFEHVYRSINTLKKLNLQNTKGSIVDVGAANGETVSIWARNFPSIPVYAFEPNPRHLIKLRGAFSKNNKINLHDVALSDTSEERIFYVTRNEVSSSLNIIDENELKKTYKNESSEKSFMIDSKIMVKTKRLDSFILETPILVLKSDTQGHDLKVLTGAGDYLNLTIMVIVEMNNHPLYLEGSQYYETDSFLRSRGFLLQDIVISNRSRGIKVTEYDGIYLNNKYAN